MTYILTAYDNNRVCVWNKEYHTAKGANEALKRSVIYIPDVAAAFVNDVKVLLPTPKFRAEIYTSNSGVYSMNSDSRKALERQLTVQCKRLDVYLIKLNGRVWYSDSSKA